MKVLLTIQTEKKGFFTKNCCEFLEILFYEHFIVTSLKLCHKQRKFLLFENTVLENLKQLTIVLNLVPSLFHNILSK